MYIEVFFRPQLFRICSSSAGYPFFPQCLPSMCGHLPDQIFRGPLMTKPSDSQPTSDNLIHVSIFAIFGPFPHNDWKQERVQSALQTQSRYKRTIVSIRVIIQVLMGPLMLQFFYFRVSLFHAVRPADHTS